MVDNAEAQERRQRLVEDLRRRGLLKLNGVESAFATVPRHLFLPESSLEEAYENRAIGLKVDRKGLLVSSASQPTMMAIMLDQAGLQPGDNVLEIGTATGYNAAIMRHIVGRDGHITTIEIDHQLAEQAQKNLRDAGYGDVNVVEDDGAQGYAPRASYDAIIATVGVWDIPPRWEQQLKTDGRLVVPMVIDGVQVSATFHPQADGTLLSVDNRPCAFVYLRGEYAGPSIRRQVGSTSLYLIADQVNEIDTASLHLLLSDDHEEQYVESRLRQGEFWYGFQLYLMLNEPEDFIFSLFAVIEGQQAYGMSGRGLALFGAASAAFAPYHAKGAVHTFAGADAFLVLQSVLDDWNALDRPAAGDLRLRLIPKSQGMPTVERGKVYTRRDHYLHAWLEV